MKASGFSQEQVAQRLVVSFATLNSWVNERSQPRKKKLAKIENLYIEIVGSDQIDETLFVRTINRTQSLHLTPKQIVASKKVLDDLMTTLIYHSNTIEGNTMTLSDVRKVIFENKTLSNRTAIEQAEARNHRSALEWLLHKLVDEKSSLKIDEQLILDIHLRLMNGIISDAGQYRQHSVRIMGAHVPTANWQTIPSRVSRLVKLIDSATDNNIVRSLARSHAVFEQIHPFSDGNGRVGRLLMLAQALRANYAPPVVVQWRKHAYYRYLELAQTSEKHKPLELFIAQSMRYSYDEIAKGGRN
ncbi:hypothetical protein MNBD_BACTEROID07-1002 [hydrothermal vent metagenome]|uniref:Uncharacterized protein n=1 Tax=hydrothermal vent metagenome TaxID=652676 RepID=A0A3B0VDR0_9ZZZZ